MALFRGSIDYMLIDGSECAQSCSYCISVPNCSTREKLQTMKKKIQLEENFSSSLLRFADTKEEREGDWDGDGDATFKYLIGS